jgi:hypothetical protein
VNHRDEEYFLFCCKTERKGISKNRKPPTVLRIFKGAPPAHPGQKQNPGPMMSGYAVYTQTK